jgi:hypothetical protein
LDKFQELSLAHDGIGKVEPGKLYLLRTVNAKLVQKPFIQWTMVLKFQGADGVGDSLK